MMTLGKNRIKYYQTSSVAKMRENVYGKTNEITEFLGFYPLKASNKLMSQMTIFNFAILFIGLVFSIVIILFVVISILLIYSLLMITTETKTFDIGIMRLIGLSSSGFVAMIFTQAVMFVLPAIITAYIASYPCLYAIFKKLFKNDLAKDGISFVPDPIATVEAVAVGLFIPLLSAIIPIQRALAKTLSESLNCARANLSGTIIIIVDKSVKIVPYLVFGILCVVFGVTIYIVLPAALLAENAALILQIFFFILVGLILGLTLLTANLRGFIEKFIVYLLLFWEKKSMRSLLKKNLMAHKQTNKLTSIIYALTLGTVVFLCVALNLLIGFVDNAGVVAPDADLYLYLYYFYAETTDPVLQKWSHAIKDFAYISSNSLPAGKTIRIRDTSRTFEPYGFIEAISASSYLDSQMNVDWHYKPSGLGLTEQLYTARGSQGSVI